jgi:hypothetical protein
LRVVSRGESTQKGSCDSKIVHEPCLSLVIGDCSCVDMDVLVVGDARADGKARLSLGGFVKTVRPITAPRQRFARNVERR